MKTIVAIVAIGTHNLRKGYQFKPKMMRTNSKNRICMQPMRLLKMHSRELIFFPFGGGGGGSIVWGCFCFVFVFPCVPTCSPSSLMCSQQHHTFLFHVVCQRRGITSSYRNFYFGSSQSFFFFFGIDVPIKMVQCY